MPDQAPKRERLLAIPALRTISIAALLYFMAVGMLFPVLPLFVRRALGGSDFSVGLVAGAFSFSAVLLRPLAGRFGDRRGRRLLLVAGASFASVAVAGYALVDAIGPLIFLRLLHGAGEACFFIGSATIVNDLAPPGRRGETVSLFSVGLYAGLSLGPLAGETILKSFGFDWVWLTSAALGLVAAAFAMRVKETRLDASEGEKHGLIHMAALGPGLILASSIWGFAGFSSFIPLYAIQIGMSGSRFLFALRSVIILAIRAVGSKIPDRVGAKKTAIISLGLSGAGLFAMGASTSSVMLVGSVALFAVGQALAFPALLSMVIEGVPSSQRGSVIGTFTAFLDVAFGIGPVTLGLVAESFGYEGVFFASGVVAMLGIAILLGRKSSNELAGA